MPLLHLFFDLDNLGMHYNTHPARDAMIGSNAIPHTLFFAFRIVLCPKWTQNNAECMLFVGLGFLLPSIVSLAGYSRLVVVVNGGIPSLKIESHNVIKKI